MEWMLFGLGFALGTLADWVMTSFLRRARDRREREADEKLLASKGLSAHLYMPGVGIDDAELHAAMDRLAYSGRIIIDSNGTVVGKLLPKLEKGPHLRLVVDNTNR